MRVAVCTNRPPAAVSACLDALLGQVPAASVALVLSGLGEAAVAAHRGSAPAGLEVLVEPRPGLSLARNRALAWAEAAGVEVICFVDDDALVIDGWWEALGRRWAEARLSVACIGGPIRPRYEVEPPAWLSPAILPALTVLDLGPSVLDLDPAATTVYGANVSFRVAPLRAVGGFDPAFGHRGRRVFFSEEDEAQRALAAAGFGVRYVPDAAVWHVIGAERLTRRSFLRRRFAYGRALGVRGARGRAEALRVGVRAAAGVLPAAVTGQRALAMQRAVRAAENAGVLSVRGGRA
jgi:GT2 family glycosyltransferase